MIITLVLLMVITGCAMSDSNTKNSEGSEKELLEIIKIVPDYKNSRYKEISRLRPRPSPPTGRERKGSTAGPSPTGGWSEGCTTRPQTRLSN